MKYVDEFRNKTLVRRVAEKIKAIAPAQNLKIMEVCGTHTQSFYRFGLDKLLPDNLRLISGPGCPVCVSTSGYIDSAIKLAQQKDVIILTFGDMLRIPGTRSTLEKERARFGNVQVAYSALDGLRLARLNPKKKIVFLAVGFETTAPTIGLSIILAKEQNLRNLFFLSSLKLIPPAMDYLAQDKRLNLDAFLCPGHVSAIIGTRPYEFIVKRHRIACCIAGFEPLDILEGIYLLIKQITHRQPRVVNQYTRAVTRCGNRKALNSINKVFRVIDTDWRGIGRIPKSGLKIKDAFKALDAQRFFSLNDKEKTSSRQQRKCRCGDILKGLISPEGCPLFSNPCHPDHPVGPCMISSEGACSVYYKYR